MLTCTAWPALTETDAVPLIIETGPWWSLVPVGSIRLSASAATRTHTAPLPKVDLPPRATDADTAETELIEAVPSGPT